jgi:hypothetical protein
MKCNIIRIDFNQEQYGRISLKAASDKCISGNAFYFLFKCMKNREGHKSLWKSFKNNWGGKKKEEKRGQVADTLWVHKTRKGAASSRNF